MLYHKLLAHEHFRAQLVTPPAAPQGIHQWVSVLVGKMVEQQRKLPNIEEFSYHIAGQLMSSHNTWASVIVAVMS
jgi:hypothetical protein